MSLSEQFANKAVLVTGASSGVGETLSLLLASRGASVTLCGRDEARLEDVRKRCVQESGGHEERFVVSIGNLELAEVRKSCVQKTIDSFGKLDVLVANAGVLFGDGSILGATEETYDTMMSVNVKGVFFLIQQAVPYLEKTQGNIVSVSSMSSTMSINPNIIYPMSKAAIDHMTRCLALDLAPKGIRVNAVNPSFIPTRLMTRADDSGKSGEVVCAIRELENERQPLGNRCVTTSEVAKTILFLASPDASFITGECILVDGARTMMGPFSQLSS